MTDPSAYVASQLGKQAETTRAADPGAAIADAPPAGFGATEVDVNQLAATIRDLQERLQQVEDERADDTSIPLAGTVKTIQSLLVGHNDPVAQSLGDDLAAATSEAMKSGDAGAVAQIAARLDRHLAKHVPYPGENYHYRNVVAFVSDLPDIIDAFKPPARPASAVGSDRAPAKVVQGSVVG